MCTVYFFVHNKNIYLRSRLRNRAQLPIGGETHRIQLTIKQKKKKPEVLHAAFWYLF